MKNGTRKDRKLRKKLEKKQRELTKKLRALEKKLLELVGRRKGKPQRARTEAAPSKKTARGRAKVRKGTTGAKAKRRIPERVIKSKTVRRKTANPPDVVVDKSKPPARSLKSGSKPKAKKSIARRTTRKRLPAPAAVLVPAEALAPTQTTPEEG
jgi:hypothetical protein